MIGKRSETLMDARLISPAILFQLILQSIAKCHYVIIGLFQHFLRKTTYFIRKEVIGFLEIFYRYIYLLAKMLVGGRP